MVIVTCHIKQSVWLYECGMQYSRDHLNKLMKQADTAFSIVTQSFSDHDDEIIMIDTKKVCDWTPELRQCYSLNLQGCDTTSKMEPFFLRQLLAIDPRS